MNYLWLGRNKIKKDSKITGHEARSPRPWWTVTHISYLHPLLHLLTGIILIESKMLIKAVKKRCTPLPTSTWAHGAGRRDTSNVIQRGAWWSQSTFNKGKKSRVKKKKPIETSKDSFKKLLFILTGQIYLYVAQMFTIASCTFIHRNECHSGKWQ